MSKVITWTDDSGLTRITVPSHSLVVRLGGVDNAIAHILTREDSVPKSAINVVVRNHSDLPADWTFRDAWKPDLTVDMLKARVIHMNRIRAMRDRELAKLDVEMSRALGKKDVAMADKVETRRQALRDIPQTFALAHASDPNVLKDLWPFILPRD